MRSTTYGIGGYDPTKPNNNIVEDVEVPDPPQRPLDPAGTLAALLVVVGVLSLEDASNAAHLSPDDLIKEALAWGATTTN